MAYETGSSRWWENYLVRYFMPSIAGMGIVAWLLAVGPSDLRSTLFFGAAPTSLDAPTLTLLILYGNLYCYIASYPVLCFHATRVTDFHQYRWLPRLSDGYVAAALFCVCISIFSFALTGTVRVVASFLCAAIFAFAQIARIKACLEQPSIKGYQKRPSALIYAFLVTLSMRRGVVRRQTLTATTAAPISTDADDEPDPTQTTYVEEESRWQKEFIDSYRHMREHGNSGFIFVLEIGLAAACYGIVRLPGLDGTQALSLIGVLFAVWAVPAVFVHMLGQHLERRYSMFDWRLLP